MALSKDDIVDVTWRYTLRDKDLLYTSLRKEVLAKRTLVPESWLVDVCVKATQELQGGVAGERATLLLKRRCAELVESVSPRATVTKTEEQGRVSGSAEWRKARGEDGKKKSNSHVFRPTEENVRSTSKKMRVRYFPATDSYTTSLDDTITAADNITGWERGVEHVENIHRKEEHDWNKVYLARTEGSDSGRVQWCVDVSNTEMNISAVTINIESTLYESGVVEVVVSSENKSVQVLHRGGVVELPVGVFKGCKTLRVCASVSGSVGDVAWQHAQLFRCDRDAVGFVGLDINISLDGPACST